MKALDSHFSIQGHDNNLTMSRRLRAVAHQNVAIVNTHADHGFAAKLFFQAVPHKELQEEIRLALLSVNGINEVHHQHLWSLDGENHVLTAHVVVDGGFSLDESPP